MKKIIVIVLVVIVLGILIFVLKSCSLINRDDTLQFASLLRYKTNSINDKNFEKILRKTDFNKYINKVDKTLNDEQECLIIYYSNNINSKNERQNFNNKKYNMMEKEAVLLFSLINDLEKIIFIDNNQIQTKAPIEDESTIKSFPNEYNREEINYKYNQDVRNYIDSPGDFLRYNIDTDIEYITLHIYTDEIIEDMSHNYEYKIEKKIIDNEDEIKTIKNFIETQNFEIPEYYTESTVDIVMDFNNGYVIKMFSGDDRMASIQRGKWNENSGKEVIKLLPVGLKEYIVKLISEKGDFS